MDPLAEWAKYRRESTYFIVDLKWELLFLIQALHFSD